MMPGSELVFLSLAQPLSVTKFASALVIAPHPDDESLGCGGTIALLRKVNISVHVLFVTDGSMSHPSSKKYPADKLTALREDEAATALQILGVDADCIRFMRIKDASVPTTGDTGFAECVNRMRKEIEALKPAVLFVPWRHDPHKDHHATAAIVAQTLVEYARPIKVLEYFVWLWERSQRDDWPVPEQVRLHHVDIDAVKQIKHKAIMAHVSQVTRLIDDDPNGFMLSPEVLAHFEGPVEYFAEMKPS